MWSRSLCGRAAARCVSLWSPYEWPNRFFARRADPLSRGLPVSSVRDVSNVLGVTGARRAARSGWGPVVRRPVAVGGRGRAVRGGARHRAASTGSSARSSTGSTCPWPGSTRTRCPSVLEGRRCRLRRSTSCCAALVALLVGVRDRAPGRARPDPADQRAPSCTGCWAR